MFVAVRFTDTFDNTSMDRSQHEIIEFSVQLIFDKKARWNSFNVKLS